MNVCVCARARVCACGKISYVAVTVLVGRGEAPARPSVRVAAARQTLLVFGAFCGEGQRFPADPTEDVQERVCLAVAPRAVTVPVARPAVLHLGPALSPRAPAARTGLAAEAGHAVCLEAAAAEAEEGLKTLPPRAVFVGAAAATRCDLGLAPLDREADAALAEARPVRHAHVAVLFAAALAVEDGLPARETADAVAVLVAVTMHDLPGLADRGRAEAFRITPPRRALVVLGAAALVGVRPGTADAAKDLFGPRGLMGDALSGGAVRIWRGRKKRGGERKNVLADSKRVLSHLLFFFPRVF